MNPHYEINPEIVLPMQLSLGGEGVSYHSVRYEVEYISRFDTKWRKWYTKEMSIDFDEVISEWRDIRIEKILKESDS